MTDLDQLASSGARPKIVDGNGAEDSAEWTAVASRLGLTLPVDYRRLVARFGRGPWANFLHVLSPFTSNEFLNFERALHAHLDALHTIRQLDPDGLPFPLLPEPGGLLPWAVTDNGDVLCWLTQGPPDSWSTVLIQPRDTAYEILEMRADRIVQGFVHGTLRSAILPGLEAGSS